MFFFLVSSSAENTCLGWKSVIDQHTSSVPPCSSLWPRFFHSLLFLFSPDGCAMFDFNSVKNGPEFFFCVRSVASKCESVVVIFYHSIQCSFIHFQLIVHAKVFRLTTHTRTHRIFDWKGKKMREVSKQAIMSETKAKRVFGIQHRHRLKLHAFSIRHSCKYNEKYWKRPLSRIR